MRQRWLAISTLVVLMTSAGCSATPPAPNVKITNVSGVVIGRVGVGFATASLMIEDPVTGIVTISGDFTMSALQIVRDVPADSLGWAEGIEGKNILRVHLHSLGEIYGGESGGKSSHRNTIIR